ncbi:TonB-dependent receptor plug domain-containing protein, partial [Lysobacter sp. 2RAB21]
MKVHARNTLAAALCAALYVPVCVHAQSQNTQPAPAAADASGRATDLDKVVVTGFRYSIEKSLDQKRNANAVVEVITAEDVSKFPDKNVADALQRVPGVVITRSGGEGKSVSVRGLAPDLTLT